MKNQHSYFRKILFSITILLLMIPLLGNRSKKPDMIRPTPRVENGEVDGGDFDFISPDIDKVGFYDPSTKIWRMKTWNSWSASVDYLVWGPNGGGWTPVTGDWDNDGVDEVGFYDPVTKIWRMRTGNTWSDSVNYLVWGPNGGGWTPVTGDWDNDGIDEVGFYDPVTKIWRMRTGNTWSDSVNYLVWGPDGG
ncbi:MAG: VCBS repeat-containing protein, partial [Anaerolineales bacterium]